jgi:hypothetical protein
VGRKLSAIVRAAWWWLHQPATIRHLLRRYDRAARRMSHDLALDYAVRVELWLEGANRPTQDWRYLVRHTTLVEALADRDRLRGSAGVRRVHK